MFSKQLIAIILCVLPALAAPSPLVLVRRNQNPIRGRYIVTLSDGVDRAVSVSSLTNKISHQSAITHEWDIVNSFAGNFIDADVELLRSFPGVASIEEDGHIYAQSVVTQLDAPWGLGRISSQNKSVNQDASALAFHYQYDTFGGTGVDVYIIDSGILTSHPAFGGRAVWGAAFGNYTSVDDFGHGTHCAGIAVSDPYGVAKSASVYAVKVINGTGIGTIGDLLDGINWVVRHASDTGRPSVASLSFSSSKSTVINDAVARLVSSGVTAVVASGNTASDAYDSSPASEPSVIAVGASTIYDARANYSNWGGAIDIWAPGSNVISTWNNGGAFILSGTSAAASYVTGYVAYILSFDHSLTPAVVYSTINSSALHNILVGIPVGTINALLNNGL